MEQRSLLLANTAVAGCDFKRAGRGWGFSGIWRSGQPGPERPFWVRGYISLFQVVESGANRNEFPIQFHCYDIGFLAFQFFVVGIEP